MHLNSTTDPKSSPKSHLREAVNWKTLFSSFMWRNVASLMLKFHALESNTRRLFLFPCFFLFLQVFFSHLGSRAHSDLPVFFIQLLEVSTPIKQTCLSLTGFVWQWTARAARLMPNSFLIFTVVLLKECFPPVPPCSRCRGCYQRLGGCSRLLSAPLVRAQAMSGFHLKTLAAEDHNAGLSSAPERERRFYDFLL